MEVKTGADFSRSAVHRFRGGPQQTARWLADKEGFAVSQHAPLDVVPFVATVFGGIGRRGCGFIRELGRRSGRALPPGAALSWVVPSYGKFWHRRLRGVMLAGLAAAVRKMMGCPQLSPAGPESDEASAAQLRCAGLLPFAQQWGSAAGTSD